MSRRRWRLLLLAELSKEMFMKIQSGLSPTDLQCFPGFAFFFFSPKRQLPSFLKLAVFLLKYNGLIYTTGQEQVSLFRFIQISVLFCYCCLLVFIL